MPCPFTQRVALVAHPTTPSDAIESLAVEVAVLGSALLALRYVLQADMPRLRITTKETASAAGTADAVAERADGLWQHTCFEAFISSGAGSYHELNFSPAWQWAAYHFGAYRDGMQSVPLSQPPVISVHSSTRQLELNVTVPLPESVGAAGVHRSRLALSAVIEDENGRLHYWSARHPPGKPDFHHIDNFLLELEL